MSGLSLGELNKYEWRLRAFVNKFYSNELFESDYGLVNLQALKINDECFEYNDLEKRSYLTRKLKEYTKGQSLWVLTKTKEFVSSKLKKTIEFGGKGSGFFTRHEDLAIKLLKEQIQEQGKVDIKIGNELYRNINFVESTEGVPKSDFHLKNIHDEDIIFISHKKGKYARDFQQYGGISKYYDHPEVLDFLKTIRETKGHKFPKKTVVCRDIQDEELKRKMIFGDDYGKEFGIDNVQILIQGEPSLEKEKDYYVFKANHIVENPIIPDSDYRPMLYATYRRRRNVLDQFVKDVRVGIYADGYRSNKEMI